jgi:polyferredoxin
VSYLLRARLVAAAHFAFSIFAVSGALLVAVFPLLLWVHLVAVFWAAGTLAFDWNCPLTPLEKRLRLRAGVPSYDTGFVQHYFLRTSDSPSEARRVHVLLSLALLFFNVLVYRLLGIL